MDKRQQAERLVSYLRWPVILVLALAGDSGHPARLGTAIAAVAIYNAVIMWCVVNPKRYEKFGHAVSIAGWILDICVISYVVGDFGVSASLHYLLYWFVLVGFGFVSGDLMKLAAVTCCVLMADAGAAWYSLGGHNIEKIPMVVGSRSIVIVLGALVAAYIAKSRGQDDLAVKRHSYINAIAEFGTKLTSFANVQELASHVLKSAVEESGACGGQLLLVNTETEELECEAFYSSTDMMEEEVTKQEALMRSYANWVIGAGKEFQIRFRGKETEEEQTGQGDRPAMAIPMLWQSEKSTGNPSVIGVLVVIGYENTDFGEDALNIMRIFATMSSAAIISLRLYTNLQKSFLRTLQSLANGLEARDEYTRGHSERVMQVACRIAEELNVPEESLDVLRNASLLHDIGKIGVPDAVLRKAGKLTSEEWETMRRHPIVSEEICRPLGLSTDVLFLIRHHHERLDTKGYPSGLTPQEQPLLQRILVVADSFDAMRSRRPYRDTVPEEELRLELNRCAGRSMDPTVTETLLSLMDRRELDPFYEEHDRLTSATSAAMKHRTDLAA